MNAAATNPFHIQVDPSGEPSQTVVKTPKKAIKTLCQKIKLVIGKILRFLCCCCCCSRKKLTAHQIKILQEYQQDKKKWKTLSRPLNVDLLNAERGLQTAAPVDTDTASVASEASSVVNAQIDDQEVAENAENERARQAVRQMAEVFATKIAAISHREHFLPKIKAAQEKSKDVPKGLKEITRNLMPIIGQAEALLTDAIALFKPENGEMDPSRKASLLWLLSSTFEKGQEEASAKQLLDACTKDVKEEHERYASLIEWLKNFSKDPTQIKVQFSKVLGDLTDEKIRKMQSKIFTKLIENKIDEAVKRLDNGLQRRIDSIVEEASNELSLEVAKILADRFSELLERVPFQEAFDQAINIVNGHMRAFLLSDNAAEAIVERVKQAKMQPGIAQLAAEIKENAELAQTNLMLTEFSHQSACHRYVKQTLGHEHSDEPEALLNYLKKINFFKKLAEQILPILMPEENGVDGVAILWRHLLGMLKEKFVGLRGEIDQFCKGILDPKVLEGLKKSLKEPIYNAVENYVVNMLAKRHFVSHLARFLEKQFELITKPEKLQALMQAAILPNIKELLLKTVLEQVLVQSKAIEKLAPLFITLLGEEQPREAQIEKIKEACLQMYSDFCGHYKGEKLTKEQFFQFVEPKIREIEDYLKQCPGNENLDSVKIFIKNFFGKRARECQKEEIELYWQLLDGPLKIGKFGSAAKRIEGYKETIVEKMLSGLGAFRTSHHALTVLISKTVTKHFATDAFLGSLIRGEELPKRESDQKEHVERFGQHVLEISQLSYDLLSKTIQEQVNKKYKIGGKFAKNYVLGKDEKHLEKVILRLYNRLFGNHLLNASVILRIQEHCFEVFTRAAQTINEAQALAAAVEPLPA